MDITKAFSAAFERKILKNWEKIYVAVDIHDTILKACYEEKEEYDYFPHALQALRMLSERNDICMILWTACHPGPLADYLARFEEEGIHFDYVNCNPEVSNTELNNFDNKLYMNVGLDDKFGFEGEKDWQAVIDVLEKYQIPITNHL